MIEMQSKSPVINFTSCSCVLYNGAAPWFPLQAQVPFFISEEIMAVRVIVTALRGAAPNQGAFEMCLDKALQTAQQTDDC